VRAASVYIMLGVTHERIVRLHACLFRVVHHLFVLSLLASSQLRRGTQFPVGSTMPSIWAVAKPALVVAAVAHAVQHCAHIWCAVYIHIFPCIYLCMYTLTGVACTSTR
jgi:hypothetical protein